MAGPFDITTRYLVETFPSHWLSLLGQSVTAPVQVIATDLATVSAEADRVIRVDAPLPWLLHLELQASYDSTMGRRLARYNLLLHGRYDLAVRSLLILLRPSADGPTLSGRWELALPGDPPYVRFDYLVFRLWQQPLVSLLNGPLGTLPLAPLADVRREELPGVMRHIRSRLGREADAEQADRLEVATYTLLGLRYPPELAQQLMPEITKMRESSTYQAILEEGRVEGRARAGLKAGLKAGSKAGSKVPVTSYCCSAANASACRTRRSRHSSRRFEMPRCSTASVSGCSVPRAGTSCWRRLSPNSSSS